MQFERQRVGSKGQTEPLVQLHMNAQAFSARLCEVGMCPRGLRAFMERDLQRGVGVLL